MTPKVQAVTEHSVVEVVVSRYECREGRFPFKKYMTSVHDNDICSIQRGLTNHVVEACSG